MSFFPPRRIWIIFFLGFSSGLPLALTSSTLSAWYTSTNMSLLSIGFLSLIGQPYVYKFLWAPLIDRYQPIKIGRRRSWMLLTQIGMIASLFIMSFLSPSTHPFLLGAAALLVALFSATQDIAISAYLTEAPKPNERGLATSFYTSSYRIAMMISGALALVIAQYYGWRITYESIAVLLTIGIIATWLTPEPILPPHTEPMGLKHSFIAPFLELLQRFRGLTLALILCIIMLYKLTDAFALSLSSVFFLRELHYSLANLGLVNKVFATIALLTGSISAGLWMRRLSLFKALALFGLFQALASGVFIWLYYSTHTIPHFAIAVFIDNFFSGMGTTAFLALIISLTHPQFAGTQFAFLSAAASLGAVYTGPIAAFTISHLGWPTFFEISIAIGITGTLSLFAIRNVIDQSEHRSSRLQHDPVVSAQ